MQITDYMERHGHEQLVVCYEPSVGLKAFIAIHDTTLGPACGGVRVWDHPTEEDAIMDVLRLARAMTYKSAVAGLPLGGGKALIWADPRTDKNEAMMRAFGRYVDTLAGRYVTTEDVGMSLLDLEYIAKETDHIVGLPESMGGSGDTSTLTGLGVYLGMKAAAEAAFGSSSLEGRVVAMQGFGHVGSNTARHLINEGARLIVTDTYAPTLEDARERGIETVEPDAIYDVECDVFSPCALGGVLNSETIPRLKCAVVAGGANNQLANPSDGVALHDRGILYAPDYVVNAGGIINVAAEMDGEYRAEWARHMTERIPETTEKVIGISRDHDIPTSVAADGLAEERLDSVRALRAIRR